MPDPLHSRPSGARAALWPLSFLVTSEDYERFYFIYAHERDLYGVSVTVTSVLLSIAGTKRDVCLVMTFIW